MVSIYKDNVVLSPKAVSERIRKKLYNFNAGEELAYAFNSKQNIILFGPGGYGKSDAAMEFFHILRENGLTEDQKPYVQVFGQGLTEDVLLGGMNIPLFKEKGIIEFNVLESFMNSEIVIFEEMFDCLPQVLLILKDILQSGQYRNGNQIFKIKTKMVIVCTNRSRDEVIEDHSTEALMQRFLFEKEVNWSSWTKNDYMNAFITAGGKEHSVCSTANNLAELCEAASSESDLPISPRTAGKALMACKMNETIKVVSSVAGFQTKKCLEIIKASDDKAKAFEQEVEIKQFLEEAIKISTKGSKTSAVKACVSLKKLVLLQLEMENMKINDKNLDLFKSKSNSVKVLYSKMIDNIKSMLTSHTNWMCAFVDYVNTTPFGEIDVEHHTFKKVKIDG